MAAMDDSISFASVCSRCGQQRPQRGYTRTALLNFFNSDYPIEAYCVKCDAFWPISPEERICIAEALAAGATTVSPPAPDDNSRSDRV
jgi:hypothetical protein